MPSANQDLWAEKFAKTLERDARVVQELEAAGWQVEVIWECETGHAALLERLREIFSLRGNAG